MKHVRINGVDVAYRRAGSGPPIVFVHGAAEDSRTWTPQFEALHDDFTVVAWDEPGGGQSGELPAEGFELADYAACLAGVIDSVRLGPATSSASRGGRPSHSSSFIAILRRSPP